MPKIHKHNTHTKQGFTLIEIIVSISLFTLVVTVALGALFLVINSNKQAKAIKLVVNNINLAMEGITRDLRVGSNYCDSQSQLETGTCDNTLGTTQVYFTTDDGEDFSSYRLQNNRVQRRIGVSGPFFDITGSDAVIEDMKFYIQGTTSGDNVQPYITIALRGGIRVGDIIDDFQLQSTISQRRLAP